MAQVRRTPQSLSDMNNIAEYIAKDSEVYAATQNRTFFLQRRSIGKSNKNGKDSAGI